MKLNVKTIAAVLILVVAMLGGLYLVNRNQETRRGAYFSGAKMLILPTDSQSTLGASVPVQLWVDTGDGSKVNAVDTKICYGSGLILNSELSTLITLNQEAFKNIEFVKDVDNCLRLVVTSGDIEPANLKSGLVKVASIRFTAAGVDSGTLVAKVEDSKVSGYNPTANATDNAMKILGTTGATYTIK